MRASLRSLALLLTLVLLAAPDSWAGDKGKHKQLMQGLRSKRMKVRLQAAIQIGKQNVKLATQALRRVADKQAEHDAVRAAALVSLAQLNDVESRSRFGYLIGHDSAIIARAAEQALSTLDRALPQPPVYLVAIDEVRLPKGAPKILARPVLETLRDRLRTTGGVVPDGGEHKFLKDEAFVAHLAKRKLMGLLLRPEVVTLKERAEGGKTTILAEVRLSQYTLPGKREEFVALGGADAWIGSERIAAAERLELQDEVLRGASETALMQVLQDLAERGAE